MDADITPSVIYGDIEKIATNGGDPSEARSRIHQFKADLAAADLQLREAAELSDKLRRMLIIASKRHPNAKNTVFQEAIDALNGEARLEEWEE